MTSEDGKEPFRLGFPLDKPAVVLEWGADERSVLERLKPRTANRVVAGQLRVQAQVLGGLDVSLELHFVPRPAGRLVEVEILRTPSRRRRKGFEEIQSRLIARLGPGRAGETTMAAEADGVVPWRWKVGKLTVTHDYYFYYTLYEKVRFCWRL